MLIVTHKECFDGLAALHTAHQALIEDNPDLRYMFMDYTNPETLPEYVPGEVIYVLDFSFSGYALVNYFHDAGRVVVIDHHKGAIDKLVAYFGESGCPSNVELILDVTKSGAGLTWDCFHPGKTRPVHIQHAEDYDLWKFEDPGTKAYIERLGVQEQTLEGYDAFIREDYLSVLAQGTILLRKKQAQIKSHVDNDIVMIDFQGYQIPCLNVPRYMTSAVGEALSDKHPFVLMYFDRAGFRHYSLRGVKGCPDLSLLAQKYNGNGHPSAAGFRMVINTNIF
jgi:oligoribonuclease NrnB/cAMP/cGMP phosphodiesterase (DHH superfamily)